MQRYNITFLWRKEAVIDACSMHSVSGADAVRMAAAGANATIKPAHRPVVVAMVAVRMMQAAVHQVIDMAELLHASNRGR